jgi:hypothetical protein
MLAVGLYNRIFQHLRDGENSRIEIAYGKVVNAFALADAFSDFTAKLYNLGSDQGLGKMRQFHVLKIQLQK